MKIELNIAKSKENENCFTVTAASGSFVGKEKFGINCTAEDVGIKVTDLIHRLNEEGLIGKK